ncbi:HIRAN domain-containing protein [Niveibacterium sp. 24ML]|uniref:HIRAN domain-containing protein n=1 Tax=Niveibacterium sp. 24ML TaxID=2985512 RepID=UPI00226E882B|nr:HIRAN domain-containing protein [Niveibacterium sp. 24ML]
MLVQRAPLAGYTHYEAPSLWPRFRTGDRLDLSREPDNPHDARAIAVRWQQHRIGYLPRAENDAVSQAMDEGSRVEARIGRLRDDPDPRHRIEIEVFLLP